MYSGGEYVTLPTVIAHLSFVSMGNYIFVEGIEGNEKEIDAKIVDSFRINYSSRLLRDCLFS